MKLTKDNISFIKLSFQKMKDNDDFLNLLNYVKKLIHGDACFLFGIKQIKYHCNPKKNKLRYYQFVIKKKSGGERIINAPNRGLKSIQKCLNLIFQTVYNVNPVATGFVPKKSIVDNARIHAASNYVYNIDLKDFFSSIDQARIWGRLQYPPFNLNEATNRLQLANIIASLLCNEMEVTRPNENNEWALIKKNVLPQGAPTSPTISNIICQQLDYYLSAVAKKFGLRYTRYADDITFSSMHNVFQKDSKFLIELHRIISQQNFYVNESKTRLQKQGYKQEVTGLIVNERPNVKKNYIKKLRMWLYLWEAYGYDKANVFFQGSYSVDKGNLKGNKANFVNVLSGKLDYLKMVKGSDSDVYKKLKQRFLKLTKSIEKATTLKKAEASKITSKFQRINHNPKKLVYLLKRFSENGNALKFSTHRWENGIYESLSDFLKKLEIEWEKISPEIYEIKKTLSAKIYAFLNSEEVEEKGWGPLEKGKNQGLIKYGWKSKELKHWCELNQNEQPFDFPIPQPKVINYDGITANYFIDITDIFKRQIEFRVEGDQLNNFFLDLRKKRLGDEFNLIQENTKGISFYTDVESFKNVLIRVFEEMRKTPEYPEIKINISEKEGYREIKVIQAGSICKRGINDAKIIETLGGDFSSIKRELENLCDWSIESKFKDEKCYRINYLVSNQEIKQIEELENCEGFTHIFKFYS